MKRKPQPLRKFSKYKPPTPRFKPGTWVFCTDLSLGLKFKVISSSHTHTQLDGVSYAVPNWLLKASRKRPVIITTK